MGNDSINGLAPCKPSLSKIQNGNITAPGGVTHENGRQANANAWAAHKNKVEEDAPGSWAAFIAKG